MDQNREDCLSKLYLIRALLSKISENRNIIKEKESDLIKEESREYNLTFSCEEPQRTKKHLNYEQEWREYLSSHSDDKTVIEYQEKTKKLNELRKAITDNSRKYNNLLIKPTTEMNNTKKALHKEKTKTKFVLLTSNVLFFLMGLSFFLNKSYSLLIIVMVAVFFANIIIIAKSKNKKFKLSQRFDEAKKEYDDLIAQEKDQNSQEIETINKHHLEIETIDKQHQELRMRLMSKIKDEIERNDTLEFEKREIAWKNKKEEFECAKALFYKSKECNITSLKNDINLLKKSTTECFRMLESDLNIIHQRDWENLDLLIYELETGRADSIKEALQQTDLLIRHNEIKQAIGEASEAICNTIQQSMSEISFSIESNMLRIHDDFISLSEEQRRIQQSLRDVVSAQELSNALREKANVSSEQLAADVKRLRELEDYRFYRS